MKRGGRYEDQAEIRSNISGWVCKTCQRFWGADEHGARYCCASDLPCACGGRINESGWGACKECRQRSRDEAWAKLERVEWDGETPLCVYDDDKFFFDSDSVCDYVADRLEDGARIEDIRLVVCEPVQPRHFEMAEFLSDDLPPDFDAGSDFDEIDQTVNDFIKAGSPGRIAGNRAVSTGCLRAMMEGVERDAE